MWVYCADPPFIHSQTHNQCLPCAGHRPQHQLARGEVPKRPEKKRGGTCSYTYSGQQVAGWGRGGARLSGRYWPGHRASQEGLSSKSGARQKGRKVGGDCEQGQRGKLCTMNGQHSWKSAGPRQTHTSAWLTRMLANEPEGQEDLPRGSHKIIPDIPVDLPQFPQNPHHRTGNILPAVAQTQTWGNLLKRSQTRLLGRKGKGAPSPERR